MAAEKAAKANDVRLAKAQERTVRNMASVISDNDSSHGSIFDDDTP